MMQEWGPFQTFGEEVDVSWKQFNDESEFESIATLEVYCSTCGGDQVRCIICGEWPEDCECATVEKFNAMWCEYCEATVDVEGEDVVFDSSPPRFQAAEIIDYEDEEEDDEFDGTIACFCNPPRSYYCAECNVCRTQTSDEWVEASLSSGRVEMGKKARRNKQKKQQQQKAKATKKSYSTQTTWDTKKSATPYKNGGGNSGYMSDRHYGTLVEIGGLEVYASSSWNSRKRNEFIPDWGLYADWCWKPSWRAEHIDWPDMSTPADSIIAFEQILVGVEKVLDGQKVEVGCIGGHGRTGTILATMGVIMGMKASDAIDHIRETYCKHAIESSSQEWYVEWAEASINGLPVPPKPKDDWYGGWGGNYSGAWTTGGSNYTNNSKKTSCTSRAHWDMWMDNHQVCSRFKLDCEWWDADVSKFNVGEISSHIFNAIPENKVAGTIVVEGFRVPIPGYKSPRHTPLKRSGCECDVCRYLNAGHGAFLMPADGLKAADWSTNLVKHERIAAARIGERIKAGLKEEPLVMTAEDVGTTEAVLVPVKDNGIVMVCSPPGDVMEIAVSDTFEPKPPSSPSNTVGERRDEYVWTANHGWVWEGLCKVPPSALQSL